MLRRLFAVAAIAGVALTACSDRPTGGGSGGSATPAEGDEALVDPIVAEGNGLGSCAFPFSVETLAERGFAFEGTVVAIREPAAMDAPYEADLDVARWYRGGPEPTTTVRTYDVSGTSLAGDLGLAVGDRILASGDEGFLWGCGFSMAYSAEGAEIFERAFAA
ncbi:MAG TPA: hypothetical protein VID69_04345 [Actinomycetota bacterium]|jgi:hypothetical protein